MTFSISVLPIQTWRSSVHLVVVTNPKCQNTRNGLLLIFNQWKPSYLVWLKHYAPLHTIPQNSLRFIVWCTKMVKQQIYKYEQDVINSVTTLEKSNPKEFWKTFKQLRELDEFYKENPIPPSEWVTHFQARLNIKPKINTNFDHAVKDFAVKSLLHFNELNFKIKDNEIVSVIQSLKSDKSPDIDSVSNEMIKCSWSYLRPHLLHVWYYPYSSEISCLLEYQYPYTGSKKGINKCYIKNKYRGIAVSSSIAKVCLSILHDRLYKFSEKHSLIPHNQIYYKKVCVLQIIF